MSSEVITKDSNRKVKSGKVVSTGMQKTIVVLSERRLRHPLYGKEIKRVKKYHVHDAEEAAQLGDTVKFVETRPLSKLKRWRLLEIVKH
jgi:small subunit ribosomal protein S17